MQYKAEMKNQHVRKTYKGKKEIKFQNGETTEICTKREKRGNHGTAVL